MSPLSLSLLIFGIMLGLMAIRIPIAISMFAAGGIGYVMQTGWSPFANFLNTAAFARFASYDLSVIPLFILMGEILFHTGLAIKVIDGVERLIRQVPGRLSVVAVVAGTIFSAISG